MKNTKLVNVYNKFVNKSAGKLRAFRAAGVAVLAALYLSCTVNDHDPTTCVGGECEATMIFPVEADKNGYYHVRLDWTREYLPYFTIDINASLINSNYTYNRVPVVQAIFDSDTSWVVGDSIVFIEPTYTPFTGDYNYSGTPLPSGNIEIILNQFKGLRVNIVQQSPVYFKEVSEKMVSKRIVGPFPPSMINDTITLYMEVFWDAGSKSILKSHYLQKFIVE